MGRFAHLAGCSGKALLAASRVAAISAKQSHQWRW